MNDINSKMTRGAAWMITARMLDRSIGIISTIILARLLVPEDFGLIAMATSISAILELLGAFGFDLALIQNPKVERKHYDTAWTFNVIFNFFCALLMIVVAYPVASFYGDDRVAPVMLFLSLSYMIFAFNNIGIVNFRKELNFRDEFILLLSRRVLTFVITITGAFYFKSYWALIIGMVSGRLISVLLSYWMHTYRPKLSLAAWRELISFSKWILANNFLFFLIHRSSDFVIGRLHGASSLGTYSVAYEIATLPSTELVAPINRVTFPGFSKIADPKAISEAYVKIFALISLLIFPIGIGIAAVASPLVKTALGQNWLAATELVELLAIYGAFAATQTSNGTVCMALGKLRLMTATAGFFLICFLPLLVYFVYTLGTIGAAYAFLIAQLINIPISLKIISRLISIKWIDILKAAWRPLFSAFLMYLLVKKVIAISLTYGCTSFEQLFIGTATGAVFYSSFVLILWMFTGRPQGAETFVLTRIRKMNLN